MQRNAIVLSTIVAFVVTGCSNLGGPPRRFANNQPVPSAKSRATTPDLQNSYASENAKQLRSSLAATPYQAYQAELTKSGEVPNQIPDVSAIPVVAANQKTSAPATATVSQHICDENCGHVHGNIGPDGVIGLPQFRLSELSDKEKQELAKSDLKSGQALADSIPNDNLPVNVEAQASVSPVLPPVGTPVTIPVAQPITIKADSPGSDPDRIAESLQTSSRNGLPTSGEVLPQNPAPQNLLPANSTFRSQGSMQVQVVATESSGEPNPSMLNPTPNSMPQLQLPPIQGELANALRQQTDPPEQFEPEIKVPLPTAPVVAPSQPEVISSIASQPPVAASEMASKPASSSGIRVDPALRNPWTNSQASQPKTPSATNQPVLRIPAQSQHFDAPAEPIQRHNNQSPSASDMLVKSASFEEPAARPTMLAAPKAAPGNNSNPAAVCIHADCQSACSCLCNNSPPAVVMSALGGISWFMACQTADSAAESASRFSTPEKQQFVLPKTEIRNEARVSSELDQTSRTEQKLVPPGLQVPVAALTTEITGFGQYERLASNLFEPGQTVLMYCELTGYAAVEKSAREGIEFTTTLESQLVVVDAAGKTVQQDSFPTLNDVSSSLRNDFYMYVPFKVGKLPTGNYQVMLRIRDANGNSSAIAGPIDFSVR